MTRRDEIRRQITRLTRNLEKLHDKKVKFGLHTPVHIETEIEDTEAEINALRQKLESLPAGLAGSRILFVDDLPDWRSMVGGLLRDYGYDTVIASSVVEARQAIRANSSFDLAIVDVRLDNSVEMDESGIDFACALRDEGLDSFEIILLTAFDPKPATLKKISRPPYRFILLSKNDIGQNNFTGLMHLVTQILPPPSKNLIIDK